MGEFLVKKSNDFSQARSSKAYHTLAVVNGKYPIQVLERDDYDGSVILIVANTTVIVFLLAF